MRNEFDDRLGAEHGHDFSAFFGRVIDDLLSGFERLVAIEFDAPWRR